MAAKSIGPVTLLAISWVAPSAMSSDNKVQATLVRWDADEHRDLRGGVVMRDGRIVAERYYNEATADALHYIRSAGKSITALLVGIAIDRGAINRADDRVDTYWPAAKGGAVGDAAIRYVLTIRSGPAAFDADPNSAGDEDRMDEAIDPSEFVRNIPRADTPGTRYRYNSATVYVALRPWVR